MTRAHAQESLQLSAEQRAALDDTRCAMLENISALLAEREALSAQAQVRSQGVERQMHRKLTHTFDVDILLLLLRTPQQPAHLRGI